MVSEYTFCREKLLNELRETEEASRRQAEVLVKVGSTTNGFSLVLNYFILDLMSCFCFKALVLKFIDVVTSIFQGLDAERDVLRESQRLASERDRELEALREQVRF